MNYALLDTLCRPPLQNFQVKLSLGSKRQTFWTEAENATRAVLSCMDTSAWQSGILPSKEQLCYSVTHLPPKMQASALASGTPHNQDFTDQVDERAVEQYNQALSGGGLAALATYTVFGTYPDCDDRYASDVFASSATEAVLLAIEEWRERNDTREVRVDFCGVALGYHTPEDTAYALPGWSRDEEDPDVESDAELQPYTVITCFETQTVKAVSPLVAESQFDSEDVAAVLPGAVENLWWAVDTELVDWALAVPYRREARLLSRAA
jgi:hypothetical protein